MSSDKKKADELYEEGNKFMSGTGGFMGKLFGFDTKYDEAKDSFSKAGSYYKLAKCWDDAAKCYLKSADICEKYLKDKISAASCYVEIGNCYRKEKPLKACDAYNEAIKIYTDLGKHSICGRHLGTCGEICEKDLKDYKKAIEYYQKAADFYIAEDSKTSSNKFLLKVAEYSAIYEEYKKAINIYEQVASDSLDNNLTKYSVKEYFFRASIIYLCYDILEAKHALERYCEKSSNFRDSRECNLIKEIIRSAEECDITIFEDALKKFDSVTRIDEWTTTLLLRVKKPLEGFIDIT